jgi:hypothetical protein
MKTCTVNVAGHECGRPIAGEIHWTGEDYSDLACAGHLALFADVTEHNVKYYPVCDIEMMDEYTRVTLVSCGELAVAKMAWNDEGAAWVCPGHLAMLAEAN